MPSVWIARRPTKDGVTRWRVGYRIGGRESPAEHGGSFRTQREARIRRDMIAGELAAVRMPIIRLLKPAPGATLLDVAQRWKSSRLDVAPGTAQTYVVSINRLREHGYGDRPLAEISTQTVADLVSELHAAGLKRKTIKKTVSHLAMILDHARVEPNPARDRAVKFPREDRRHVQPPTADHVEAVAQILPARYVLPVLVLDATGMRIGELEGLTWGDVDEPRGRWRIASAVSKTGRPRWVTPDPFLFAAVTDLVPRDDRHADRRVFEHVTGDRLRTQLTRSCTAAGVPAFSPHDLRHRRVSLLHLGGMPWARIGELVGHDAITSARTYTHVLADENELDYATLLK